MVVNALLALYVGPDQMMPLASILATVVGFFMIFWHKLIGLLRKLGIFRRKEAQDQDPPPQGPEPPKNS